MNNNQAPGSPQNRKPKFSNLFYNFISYAGAILALFVFFIEVLLFAFDFFSPHSSVYLGIITYTFLPVFLIIGLILIPVGALRKRRRISKGLEVSAPKTLFIDPSIPAHRNAIFVFGLGTSILLLMTAIGTYKAYHYTESVQFCGLTCHKVMKPEHTAYTNSAHARVKCVECHIGEGADWYVRSKISGIRQIYHAIKGDYSRPIPTPVHNLRPAKETCERCHWPDKFYSSFEINRKYFSSYESEAPQWLMRMLVHVGTSEENNNGIHAHMYLNNDIYFAAEDERLQNITWVKSVDKEGNEKIFTAPESKWAKEPPPKEIIHKMDCIDCHNRPTHDFNPPNELVNHALNTNQIDPTLPNIKSKAMELLSDNYQTEDQAIAAINESLRQYYKDELGEEYTQEENKVTDAIAAVSEMFRKNIFPEMKARWDAYPNNIGHMTSPGCFRCHDGEHSSNSGAVITNDCTTCHTIIEQGPVESIETNTRGLPFVHPFEDDGLWQEMKCSDCHTGN